MTVLKIFIFESQLMQMPGPRGIVIYRPGPWAFSIVQKPWGWAHVSVQKPRGAQRGGVVTGQIDTCINSKIVGSTGAPSKAFVVFLFSDWLKPNLLRSRIERGFLDIFHAIFVAL